MVSQMAREYSLTHTCRLCCRQDDSDIYVNVDEDESTKKAILALFTGLTFDDLDLPSCVCENCYAKTVSFYDIWKNQVAVQSELTARFKSSDWDEPRYQPAPKTPSRNAGNNESPDTSGMPPSIPLDVFLNERLCSDQRVSVATSTSPISDEPRTPSPTMAEQTDHREPIRMIFQKKGRIFEVKNTNTPSTAAINTEEIRKRKNVLSIANSSAKTAKLVKSIPKESLDEGGLRTFKKIRANFEVQKIVESLLKENEERPSEANKRSKTPSKSRVLCTQDPAVAPTATTRVKVSSVPEGSVHKGTKTAPFTGTSATTSREVQNDSGGERTNGSASTTHRKQMNNRAALGNKSGSLNNDIASTSTAVTNGNSSRRNIIECGYYPPVKSPKSQPTMEKDDLFRNHRWDMTEIPGPGEKKLFICTGCNKMVFNPRSIDTEDCPSYEWK